jgi:hypothetical protein
MTFPCNYVSGRLKKSYAIFMTEDYGMFKIQPMSIHPATIYVDTRLKTEEPSFTILKRIAEGRMYRAFRFRIDL